ncbi:MAG: Stk1 family PASTA domain-containing Ser/Thr kinase [Lachnospiraceae bacterium]|nr:Stk1 family PASTA domain-containing Ser/Thr kinase [Lachnospiraceae bacterium]
MVKIGMIIGERYEILERIGTGGMSDVYKAKCHKLNRNVAVKVLKQEFSENETFVSKFRIEAQAAAGLVHPNVVNVYDVGEENGIYYIVMELVEGITLKKYIEKKNGLAFKEAVNIAIQVCLGMGAAHHNKIIHRDIKPQNIIISKDGKVKVTDFGIAKAATSDTITTNVMGSVHYTSPEQARGGFSNEQSDIYSLGITLFEMLTGQVPFDGENTVAIAIQHIQEEMPKPSSFLAGIPLSIESIVMKCCQKSPDRRYQSAAEVVADLKKALQYPDEDVVALSEVQTGGTRKISEEEIKQIKEMTENEPDEGKGLDFDRLTTILAIAGGIVILLILIFMAVQILGRNAQNGPEQSEEGPIISEEATEYVKMKKVVGMTVEDARNVLTDLELVAIVDYVESAVVEKGVVMSTDVEVGAEIAKGSTVTLTASAGVGKMEVPSVVGNNFVQANDDLAAMGFAVSRVDGYSNDVEVGCVIGQVPAAGTMVPSGTNITLTVSIGKDKLMVPNVMGYTEAEAVAMMTEAGLTVNGVTYVYNTEYEAGKVCYQGYSGGSYVDHGTVVDIKVSKGAQPYTYKCNTYIEAPTEAEAPDYESGTEVTVLLVTDDGQELMNTKVTDFPKAANYYGLKSPGGTITMTYTVTGEGTTSIDPESGEQIVTPAEPVEKTFTRRIEFIRE